MPKLHIEDIGGMMLYFIRYSILPIVLAAEFFYFVYFIGWRDQCTGTSSRFFSTMLICHGVWSSFFFVDFFLVSTFVTFVWIRDHEEKYIGTFRLISLLYLLVIRFFAIWLSTSIQTRPFIH